MMNEEEYLKSKVGNRNPFTVPEGYFEQLAQQVMDRIPATTQELKPAPKKTVFKQLRPWLYAAACVCVGVFTAGVLFNSQNDNSKGCTCPPEFPVCVCGKTPQVKLVTRKPILPGKEELEENPRARSAKLRVAERL